MLDDAPTVPAAAAGVTDQPDLARLVERLQLLDPARLAAAVSLLPAEVLAAVRAGVEVGFLRHGQVLDEDWPGGRYHREHPILVSQMQRRRWPPHGDRDEWIQWGPAGAPRPAEARREAAA